MTVTPLDQRRQTRDAGLAAAMHRHPSLLGQTVHVPLPDRARALEVLCRRWTEIVESFSAGPDSLEPDEAEELLQFLVAGVAHPAIAPALCMQLPQLRAAVAQYDQVRDGDIHPFEVGCSSHSQALAQARAELDWQLVPFVHGWPAHDACPVCVRVCQSVGTWQRRASCTDHRRSL